MLLGLEQRNHNPRVGGSSPSSATISFNAINILQHLKNDFEAFFPLHTSYTLFGWLPDALDYIVFIVIGCVRCLFCVKILCWLWMGMSSSIGVREAANGKRPFK
jgi:hypothetical protein